MEVRRGFSLTRIGHPNDDGFDYSKLSIMKPETQAGRHRALATLGVLGLCLLTSSASAQVMESVGVRALGMGGAFVAVASDSTTTWWNPAGLPAGPFVDISIAGATTDAGEVLPVRRERTTGVALLTPPLGLAYYRFRVTDIRLFDPTGGDADSREQRRAGSSAEALAQAEVPIRSLSAGQ